LPYSLELEHADFRCCTAPSLFFTLSDPVTKCLDKAGPVTDGVWKIETGRTEHNVKVQDQRHNASQADKVSTRSVGKKM
jgi:hypothetical protein